MSWVEEEENNLLTIVDEREEEMVPFTGGRAIVRLARFLKPCLEEVGQVPSLPKVRACTATKCSFDVNFKGWKCQQKRWKEWVDQLRPMHETIWRKTGIYDSIITSTFDIPKDKELVLGLADSWCHETNTFVFTWGEATVTLEDMLILGGFSVLGESVDTPLTGNLVEIENEMMQKHKELVRSKAHKAGHGAWLRQFIGVADHLEHPAFITLWLSRYVLPTKPEETIDRKLFSAAIRISQGTPIALAPVVLAGLYRDLGVIKEQMAISFPGSSTVWAPFQILQLWAWERFLSFQPTPNSLHLDVPRAARWNKVWSKLTIDLVRRSVNLRDEFQWRPYSSRLEKWQHPLYYKEHGELVTLNSKIKKEVLSLLRCFIPCELVGLDCIEKYAPHRVGMQFGMDQDIPGAFTQANVNWEIAWRTNDKFLGNIRFYIPPRLFESDVTTRYFDWWKQSNSIKQAEMKSISMRQMSSSSPSSSSESERLASPGFTCKQRSEDRSENDEDKMTLLLSDLFKQEEDHAPINGNPASCSKYIARGEVQSCASITKDEATTRKEQMMNGCLHVKARMENGDKVEEDKELQMNDSDEFLVDLEMRVNKLENVIKWLKANRRQTTGSPSHV